MATQEQNFKTAEQRFNKGIEAFNDGKLDVATEAFGDAEIHFRLSGDFKRAGDSRMMIADVQRQLKQFEQATSSYQKARTHYQEAQRPLNAAEATLSLGHIERQQAHLDLAQQAYEDAYALYLSLGSDQGQGNVALAMGHIMLQRSQIDQAIRYYQQAIDCYVKSQDVINEADARRSAADILLLSGRYTEAIEDYKRCLEVYQQRHDFFGEVDALVGLGKIDLEQQELERASDTLAEAISKARNIEYELGIADGNLGLAEIALLSNRVDQALTSGQLALQNYTSQQNALGTARANALLARIYLRRGQPAYANSLMDRAQRTLQAIAYRIGLAEVASGMGAILLARGFLERSLDAFHEARQLARAASNQQVESEALLGLSDVYRQRGEFAQARKYSQDALEHTPDATAGKTARGDASARLRLARLATLTGELDTADQELQKARNLLKGKQLAANNLTCASLIEGQLLLVEGDFARAETRFNEARNQAETLQEPLIGAEALLGLANTRLARNELDAAQATFIEAGRQFQQLESVNGDGAAMLGLAEISIARKEWAQAIEDCNGALLRFNQADDQPGLADAELTLGLAHQGNDRLDEAQTHFGRALEFYHKQPQPLGEADTCYERAGILLTQGDLSAALQEINQAVTLIELVLRTRHSQEQRQRFLSQYTELYAQKAITLARLGRETEGQDCLKAFAQIAGAKELKNYLQTFEASIPTEVEELSGEQIAENQALLKRLRQMRKGL